MVILELHLFDVLLPMNDGVQQVTSRQCIYLSFLLYFVEKSILIFIRWRLIRFHDANIEDLGYDATLANAIARENNASTVHGS